MSQNHKTSKANVMCRKMVYANDEYNVNGFANGQRPKSIQIYLYSGMQTAKHKFI